MPSWLSIFSMGHEPSLGGETSTILIFTPKIGKIFNLTSIFQMGWFNHQLVVINGVK